MRIAFPAGVVRWTAGLLSLLAVGCGPDFDPPSELHSLRILAVQKDIPYAQPGDTVNLQMLWQDASPLAGPDRKIQIAWSPPCFNPAGDLYYACFSDPDTFGDMVKVDPSNPERTSVDIPTNIISSRPAPTDGSKNPPYGLTYVFFAACAGQLTLLSNSGDNAFPVGCKDASGKLLGADDFVAGYTSIYSFDGFSNHNPVIKGFEFRGNQLPDSRFCLGDDCLALDGSTPALDFDCDDPENSALCIPTCADDGDPSCTGYGFRPTIDKNDPANQDQDDVSVALLGRDVGEQMWVNYYTDAGGFKSPVRLLNDATNGWNDDYGTEFYAPKEPGPLRIWAVAHDNRGGMSWAGITLKAQ
ncbi:MAG TPA: hypothetical protein VER11_03820 [Polyangiaceae bacterium]|nr:hypothetical protein [Polyangiaceae bacterium]